MPGCCDRTTLRFPRRIDPYTRIISYLPINTTSTEYGVRSSWWWYSYYLVRSIKTTETYFVQKETSFCAISQQGHTPSDVSCIRSLNENECAHVRTESDVFCNLTSIGVVGALMLCWKFGPGSFN